MDVGQVTFSINANGLDAVLAKVGNLQSILNGIDGRTYGAGTRKGAVTRGKTVMRATAQAAKQATKETNAYNRAVKQSLRNEKQKNAYLTRVANQEIKRRNLALKERFKTAKRMARLERDQLKAAEKSMTEQNLMRANYQKAWQTNFVNMGAQMQTLGRTMQTITSPFMNIYTGFTRMAGMVLYNKLFQGISNAFSRYDTINTYAKSLQLLGMSAEKEFSIGNKEAMTSIKNLEQSVLGLPTGLDEIVAAMRRYAGATGDVERATKLAIAANNAYIAGNMDDRQKLFTERQLLSLSGGAELSANQWDSLRRNAPLAVRAVADEMHMDVQQMVSDLKDGTIKGQEFLDVFIKVGTEGKLKDAAEVMKQTWDAVGQNIQNALNRAGEGILNTLDEIYKKEDGRTFLQHILGVDKKGKDMGDGIKGFIDGLSQSAKDWIKANPHAIIDFLNDLKKVDWTGIIGGFAKMGLYVGKFYAWIGKFASSNGITKFIVPLMVFTNMFGKALMILGGLTKGLAIPLSKLFTVLKFGFGAKMGTNALKSFSVMTKAGKAATTMAMQWQNVAAYAVTIAAIPAIAWSLKEIALALQEFGKVKFSASLVNNMALGITALGLLGTFVTAIGTFLASNPAGWVAIAGSAVGTAEIAGLSKAIKWIGEGLNAIANADIPSASKIKSVMKTMDDIGKYFTFRNPFEALGKMVDAWTTSAEFKAIAKLGDAFTAVSDIASLELPKGWENKSIKRLTSMRMIISAFEKTFAESGKTIEGEKGRNTRNGFTSSTQTTAARIKTFADSVESISGVTENMVSIIENAIKINKKLDKAVSKMPPSATKGEKNTGLFSQVTDGIKQITQGLYDFLKIEGEDGEPMFKNLQQVCSAFSGIHMGNIKNQLNYVPEMINSIVSINKQLTSVTRGLINTNGTTYLSGISGKIKPIFDDISNLSKAIPTDLSGLKKVKSINSSLKKVMTTFTRLKELSALNLGDINVPNLNSLATQLRDAFAALDEINGKKFTVEFEAEIKGQDEVIKEVKSEIDKLKKKINGIPAEVTKKVTVSLTEHTAGIAAAVASAKAGINAAMDAIKDIPSTVNKTITVNTNPGGRIVKQSGGKVFRAEGGAIRRGTDSVEALLTPGEWVMNHRASNMIGDDVLNKLNHLDIHGALNSLSLKAGQIQNRTINNNSTKNANVTVNNYHSDGIGYSRASRVVRSL